MQISELEAEIRQLRRSKQQATIDIDDDDSDDEDADEDGSTANGSEGNDSAKLDNNRSIDGESFEKKRCMSSSFQ